MGSDRDDEERVPSSPGRPSRRRRDRGRGFTGLSAALHLAEAGIKALVLEAHEPGWGASGRNGGQVIPGLKYDPDELESHFGPEVVKTAGGGPDLVFS